MVGDNPADIPLADRPPLACRDLRLLVLFFDSLFPRERVNGREVNFMPQRQFPRFHQRPFGLVLILTGTEGQQLADFLDNFITHNRIGFIG